MTYEAELLRELAERWETSQPGYVEETYKVLGLEYDPIQRDYFQRAAHGSLDAAKALHDAMLPGEIWTIGSHQLMDNPIEYSAVECILTQVGCDGFAKTPSVAWVAAILRAKAKESENG